VDPEDLGSEPRAQGRRRQRAGQPVTDRKIQRLADEVLAGKADQHRPAGPDELVESPRQLE
jgi:hypothetical protein